MKKKLIIVVSLFVVLLVSLAYLKNKHDKYKIILNVKNKPMLMYSLTSCYLQLNGKFSKEVENYTSLCEYCLGDDNLCDDLSIMGGDDLHVRIDSSSTVDTNSKIYNIEFYVGKDGESVQIASFYNFLIGKKIIVSELVLTEADLPWNTKRY